MASVTRQSADCGPDAGHFPQYIRCYGVLPPLKTQRNPPSFTVHSAHSGLEGAEWNVATSALSIPVRRDGGEAVARLLDSDARLRPLAARRSETGSLLNVGPSVAALRRSPPSQPSVAALRPRRGLTRIRRSALATHAELDPARSKHNHSSLLRELSDSAAAAAAAAAAGATYLRVWDGDPPHPRLSMAPLSAYIS